jgi:tetratricopeptide (TPR) repeat protein
MGVVVLGHDTALDRPVAIKVLRPEQATAHAAERFLREARLLAKVHHPAVVPIHQVAEGGGLYYCIMEYLSGETVADRLRRGPLPAEEVLRLGADLLAGLQAVHELEIVHRDVKPSNIFLLPDRTVLTDFGIAQPGRDSDLTSSSEIVGTIRYMPLEQLSASRVDRRADLYSAAVVLCEALLGELPPVPATYGDSMPWARIPRRFRAALRRALQTNPDDRWRDAAGFRDAFTARPLIDLRRGSLGAGAIGAAVVAWALVGAGPRTVLHPADLAVLPFESVTDTRTGDQLARHIADRLGWFGRWRLQPSAVTFAWASDVPLTEREDRAARELKAAYYVVGRVLPGPASSTVELTIRDSAGRAVTITPIRVAGTADDMPSWGRDAADSIAARIFPQFAQEFRELGGRAVGDAKAYEEYFRGEEAFQRDAYEDAERYYLAALARDSGFVEASLRLAIVRRFRRVPFEADLKHLYERSAYDLPPQHRLLIEALLEPDLTLRFQRYREAVTAFPRDATVRFVYADELFHRGPLIGIPLDSAVAELTRLVEMHPHLEQAPAYDHLLWGYLRLGRQNEADASLRSRIRLVHGGESEEDRQRRRFLQLARDARFGALTVTPKLWWLSSFADSATLSSIQRYVPLGNSFEVPETQLALGRTLVAQASLPAARAAGHRAQGLALMLLGRPAAALAQLDTAIALSGTPDSAVERSEWRVLPRSLGLPDAGVAERNWGRSRLEALARLPAPDARAAWALAVEAAAGGASAMGRWRPLVIQASRGPAVARRLSLLLDAMSLARRGSPDSALALSIPLLAYDSTGVVEDPFARAVLHLERADWALALGDSAAADRELLWYENSDIGIEGWIQTELQSGEVDAMLSGVVRLRRARLALASNETSRACGWLGRLGELWREAEPVYAALVTEARELSRRCPG